MIKNIISILSEKNIKPTPMRMLVLEEMMTHNGSLSLNELEKLLIDSDRVTIYRTLELFVKHGIAHSVDLVNRGRVYALCDDSCSPEKHRDAHPHFLCESCRKVFCSDDFTYIIDTSSAKNYTVNSVEVMIRGICPACNK